MNTSRNRASRMFLLRNAAGIITLACGLGLLLSNSASQTVTGSLDATRLALRSEVSEGQSVTLLPNGLLLLIGGEKAPGAVILSNPNSNSQAVLSTKLHSPRSWHSATLLPDGSVLIFGGVDSEGKVIPGAEFFYPETEEVKPLALAGLPPRAYHSATLLTDGQVLIVGGSIQSAELWDVKTRTARLAGDRLHLSRYKHAASLLPDGNVLLWGGFDEQRNPLGNGELYDAGSESFTETLNPPSSFFTTKSTAFVEASTPADNSIDVPVDTWIALRFSKPVRMNTLNADTIALTSSQGAVAAKITPAEGGMLAFVIPEAPLLFGTTHTLSLSGARDEENFQVPSVGFSFTTADGQGNPGKQGGVSNAIDGEEWIPDETNLRGKWRSGLQDSPWRSLPPLQAAAGITALSGQVLTLGGQPLAKVSVKVGPETTQTDITGRFLLTSISAGHQVLKIDGRTLGSPGLTYGFYKVGIDLTPGRTNVLPFTVWMTKIDTAHAAKFESPAVKELILTTPRIPGLEVRIPAGSVIRDSDGQAVTQLSITPIPTDRPPFPLPPGIDVPVFFTVQPGGSYILPPRARIIYPNYTSEPAGARINFWNYDAENRGWYIYGQGTVTADRRQVIPDAGVAVYEFSGAMINTGNTPPPNGPRPGNCGGTGGDPVDCGTGLFVYQKTDLFLSDTLPLSLTRTYRPEDSASRPFGIGATHPYEMFLWSAQQYQEADLILPDGGRVHYIRTSPGVSFTDAEFEHTATPTAFYKSKLKWNGNGWDLTLKDGTVFIYGENKPLQSIRDRYGNKITLTRSSGSSGNITQITSPNNRWIQFTYDTSNRITQAKDNIGRIVNYIYDASGRLWKVTDAKGGVTEYTYDSSHRMLTIKDPRTIVFLTNEYDIGGRVIKQTQPDNSTYLFAYTINGAGKITQTDETDPRGNIRRIQFNSDGYTVTTVRALGKPEQQTTVYERQPITNLITKTTDALNRSTEYGYDELGNLNRVTRLAGTSEAVTTSFSYNPAFSRLASVTDPLGHTTSFGYDLQGDLIGVTDPLSHQTTFGYDSAGQLISATDPLGASLQIGYELGDPTTVIDPLGRVVTRFIDNAGRLAGLTNSLGHTIRYEYDNLNQVTRVTDPLQGATSLTHDPNGNLLNVTDAHNGVTTYTYNNMDRVVTRKDPLLHEESYLHDPSGNLQQITDRKSQLTGFTNDPLNRLKQVTYADTSTTTYSYDAGDRITQVVDSLAGTITRTYDNLDRLTSETTPQGSVSYTYDAAGRRTSMTVLGQPAINYAYDNADRLTSVTQGTTTVTMGYDSADRRTSLTLPNGVVVEYSYDTASQLTEIGYKLGMTALGNLTYEYDAAGKRTKVGGSFSRTGLPQPLTSAVYNADNQLTQWGTTSLSYDLNGNLVSDGTNTLTWNARDQLMSLSGGVAASFQYDAFGRRASKAVGGTSIGFVYDGVNPIQELSGGTPTANLLTGLTVDESFQRTDAAGTRILIADGLGSSLALLDSSGALQTQYTYEPFGKTTVTGTSSANAVQFTGRENDNTGLYYYRARYYSPTFQRFVSEDPIGFAGGDINLGAYVRNNPINYVDPLGFSTFSVHFGETFWSEFIAGRGVINSLIAATGSMMPDRFQETSSDQTNLHGMAGRKPNGDWQTHEQAKEGSRRTIERLLEIGRSSGSEITNSLARGWAHHVVQDSWAGSHRYSPWPGGWLPDPEHRRNDRRDFNHLYLNNIEKPCHGLF